MCLNFTRIRFKNSHDDVIKWKNFPRYWPYVRQIHRSSVNFPHNGWWRGALMVSLICVWINGWVNKGAADDLTRHRAHYDVTLLKYFMFAAERLQGIPSIYNFHLWCFLRNYSRGRSVWILHSLYILFFVTSFVTLHLVFTHHLYLQ